MDTQSLFSLAGRTALVTGGSRGIGKMIASGFIAQGAKVYISSRKADVCEAVAEELGPNCIAVPQDISTVDGCKTLAATMAEHESGLDILVNNAGAAWGESFETFPEAGWDKVMNLNVKSIFFLTQAMHDLLKAGASSEQPAKVINIASIAGKRPLPGAADYCVSKAGVIMLTTVFATELATKNIRVNAIGPGFIETPMTASIRQSPEWVQTVMQMTPMQRFGQAHEIANTALFLASDESSYVSGQTLYPSGGMYTG